MKATLNISNELSEVAGVSKKLEELQKNPESAFYEAELSSIVDLESGRSSYFTHEEFVNRKNQLAKTREHWVEQSKQYLQKSDLMFDEGNATISSCLCAQQFCDLLKKEKKISDNASMYYTLAFWNMLWAEGTLPLKASAKEGFVIAQVIAPIVDRVFLVDNLDWQRGEILHVASQDRLAQQKSGQKSRKADAILRFNIHNDMFELLISESKTCNDVNDTNVKDDYVKLQKECKDSYDNYCKRRGWHKDHRIFGIHTFGTHINVYWLYTNVRNLVFWEKIISVNIGENRTRNTANEIIDLLNVLICIKNYLKYMITIQISALNQNSASSYTPQKKEKNNSDKDSNDNSTNKKATNSKVILNFFFKRMIFLSIFIFYNSHEEKT